MNGIADVLLTGRLAPAEPEPTARAVVSRTRLERYAGLYADDLGRPLYISLHGDSLILGERNGPLLLPQTERRFRRADGRTEYEFLADGGVVAMRPYFPFRVAYARTQPARHTPESLTSYAGTYVSDELGSSYDVTVDGAALTMKTRWGPSQPLRAVHADYFEGADGVRFTRDKSGVVNGFLIQGVRLRNLRFARVR